MSNNNNYFQGLLEEKIFPLTREQEQLNYVIERMTRFMHENPLTVGETIVGGSYGKNTMIRGRAEVDLVYVLTPQSINLAYDDLIDHLLDLALEEFNQNQIEENNFSNTSLRGMLNYHMTGFLRHKSILNNPKKILMLQGLLNYDLL